ncbi:unnamed protein product [Leuciscus chuanchicus]
MLKNRPPASRLTSPTKITSAIKGQYKRIVDRVRDNPILNGLSIPLPNLNANKVNSCVLQTRALEERHSAANLADYLKTSVEQWGLDGKVVACTIEEILPVLHSLKIASEALGGENYVSVSMVYPLVQSLLSRHLQMSGGESQKVNEFKNTAAASLKQRINIANLQNAGKTPLLASALDPRHKHLRFLDENMREAVREKLFEQYQSISFDVRGAGAAVAAAAACVPASDGDESVPVPSHRRRLSLFFGEDYRESSRDEWEQFLMEPCIPPDEDPMNWITVVLANVVSVTTQYASRPQTSSPATHQNHLETGRATSSTSSSLKQTTTCRGREGNR